MATAIVWLAVPNASSSPIPIVLLVGLIPYSVFLLVFLAATLSFVERDFLRALLWAPPAFLPFLFVFLLIPTAIFPNPFGSSALLALVFALGFGYAYVGVALLLYYLLRLAGVIARPELVAGA